MCVVSGVGVCLVRVRVDVSRDLKGLLVERLSLCMVHSCPYVDRDWLQGYECQKIPFGSIRLFPNPGPGDPKECTFELFSPSTQTPDSNHRPDYEFIF